MFTWIKLLLGIENKTEPVRSETCEHCAHLYYNNDGSVDCDSPYANACIRDNTRMFKEFDHDTLPTPEPEVEPSEA